MTIHDLIKKATSGPFHVYKLRYGTDGRRKAYDAQIRDENHDIIMVPSSYGQHTGAPQIRSVKVANAQVFSHCVNHFPEALEALKAWQETYDAWLSSDSPHEIEFPDSHELIEKLESVT